MLSILSISIFQHDFSRFYSVKKNCFGSNIYVYICKRMGTELQTIVHLINILCCIRASHVGALCITHADDAGEIGFKSLSWSDKAYVAKHLHAGKHLDTKKLLHPKYKDSDDGRKMRRIIAFFLRDKTFCFYFFHPCLRFTPEGCGQDLFPDFLPPCSYCKGRLPFGLFLKTSQPKSQGSTQESETETPISPAVSGWEGAATFVQN